MAGKKDKFQKQIEFYAQMAENIDSTGEETELDEEFYEALESDPSQAELMIICQAIHTAFITLKFKKDLRGAIAFMCALSFPLSLKNPVHQHRDVILCTTVIIIIVTMLVFGWPTTSLLKVLDIKRRDDSRLELNPDELPNEGAPERPTSSDRSSQHSLEQQREQTFSNVTETHGGVRGWMNAKVWEDRIKRILMTSDAIIERADNNALATTIRSQRLSGAFARPNSGQSAQVPFINVQPPEGDSGRLSTGTTGRPSAAFGGRTPLKAGIYSFGVPPQGCPIQPLPAGVYSYWEDSTSGRPSALASERLSSERPSVARSTRMLCNP